MNPVIRVSNLTKKYQLYNRNIHRLFETFSITNKQLHKEFFALKNVSFEITAGKSFGIIGLNGSGKSTLLQCIAGVLTPTSGSIQVTGKIAALLELGAGFNGEFTGIENVEFQCGIMGLSNQETKALLPAIEEFADIGDFINHPVKTYSSGMYVRLAFSVAISVDPEILIVDEALAVGDIRFQAKCLAKIRELRAKGKTLIFVSHDSAAIKSLCDEAILLNHGSLITQGDPSKVFDVYNSLIAEKDSKKADTAPAALQAAAKRSGNRRVEFTAIELLNEKSLPSEVFVTGDLMRVRLTLKAKEATPQVTVGFLIRDRLGQDIYGTNTSHEGKTLNFTEQNLEKTVEFSLDLALGPNIYTISAAAHTGENHLQESFDWYNEASVFRVIFPTNKKFSGCAALKTRTLIS